MEEWKHAYVFKYKCVLSEMRKTLKVKEFRTATVEWLDLIVQNRISIVESSFDVIIGPTADALAQKEVTRFIKENLRPTIEDKKKLIYV